MTNYAYDASGEHLLSVTGPGGTTSYTYLSGLGAASEHALNSITQPDGTHVYYGYDDRGRLIQSSRDGSVDAVTYEYPAPGACQRNRRTRQHNDDTIQRRRPDRRDPRRLWAAVFRLGIRRRRTTPSG